jgi:asparagine synthetase B (glutamine-hydrolysing)
MREEWLPPFLSEHYSDHLLDQYDRFGLNKHNTVYDRTGHLPHYLNMDPKHTMPGKVDGFNKTFWEITVNRAKELLSIGKPINVLWSGGLDSTYILFVLKHFANDPEQVRVFGTYNSIIESGDLFDRRIKKEFMQPPEYPYVAWKCLAGDKADNIPSLLKPKKVLTCLQDPGIFAQFMAVEENRAKFNINRQLIELNKQKSYWYIHKSKILYNGKFPELIELYT